MTSSEIGGGVILLGQSLAWVAWIGLTLAALVRERRGLRSADGVALLLLTAGAWALRVAAPAVQHDVNPRLDEVFGPWSALRWSYTHGLVALTRVVWAAGASLDDRAVFSLVAGFGALTAPLAAVLTARLGGGRAAAAVAGVVMAGLGLHVRYSHTDAPQVIEGMLTLVGAVALTQDPTRRTAADTALAALSLALAATLRPEALAIPPLVLAWAWACGLGLTARQVVVTLAAAALVALPDAAGVMLSGGGPTGRGAGLDHGHGALLFGVRHFVVWNSAFVPAALGLLPLLAPWGRAPTRRALATFGLLLAVGSLVGNAIWSIADTASWCLARHQLRVLPWMVVLIGLGAEALTDAARAWVPLFQRQVIPGLGLIGVAWVTRGTLRDAYTPFTLSDEYTFLRETLPTIPPDCAVASLTLGGDRGLSLPEGPPGVGPARAWLGLDGDLSGRACVVYYRSAQCTVAGPGEADPGDRCAAFEAAWTLTPIAERQIVARGWLWEHYATPTLRVGYYRVGPPTP